MDGPDRDRKHQSRDEMLLLCQRAKEQKQAIYFCYQVYYRIKDGKSQVEREKRGKIKRQSSSGEKGEGGGVGGWNGGWRWMGGCPSSSREWVGYGTATSVGKALMFCWRLFTPWSVACLSKYIASKNTTTTRSTAPNAAVSLFMNPLSMFWRLITRWMAPTVVGDNNLVMIATALSKS